ncbi:putative F-box domain-containing protein [Rosa chinensis]|uniref:Putative F-box domain-containing protein n=1 Tax=Rosa chinensis TaxID=74649 RepID=A0A2P6PV74_ROSCH|nr:putative F-box protein At1g47390 [Rosa chinensis]PRQ25822.1 putative F-box domain-containing protein [Rosa chinensis]
MEPGASFLALADESILVEILLRLPLKSICRFRCVSKEWDGLTKLSYFLDRHRLHSSRCLLLISSSSLAAGISNKKGVGISLLADEETAVSSLSVPFLPKDARWALEFVGSSNGLLCCVTLLKGTRIATVVWNPATDQFNYFPVGLEKRVENATYYRVIIGFDFMHSISAYKLVTVHPCVNPINDPNQLTFQARVFNPSRNSWRVVEPQLELTSCRRFNIHSITVNGVLYWLVEKQTAGDLGWLSFRSVYMMRPSRIHGNHYQEK